MAEERISVCPYCFEMKDDGGFCDHCDESSSEDELLNVTQEQYDNDTEPQRKASAMSTMTSDQFIDAVTQRAQQIFPFQWEWEFSDYGAHMVYLDGIEIAYDADKSEDSGGYTVTVDNPDDIFASGKILEEKSYGDIAFGYTPEEGEEPVGEADNPATYVEQFAKDLAAAIKKYSTGKTAQFNDKFPVPNNKKALAVEALKILRFVAHQIGEHLPDESPYEIADGFMSTKCHGQIWGEDNGWGFGNDAGVYIAWEEGPYNWVQGGYGIAQGVGDTFSGIWDWELTDAPGLASWVRIEPVTNWMLAVYDDRTGY